MNDLVKAIEELSVVREMLAWPFDFEIHHFRDGLTWFEIEGGDSWEVIAKDGTGSLFILCNHSSDNTPLLYISSEGEAGVIARNLSEGLRLIITLPYWCDLLKFSGNGKLEEMIRALPFLENAFREHEPDIQQMQSYLLTSLELEPLNNPVELLHSNVQTYSTTISVISPEGDEFASLFNRFTVADNPMWN